MTTSSTEAATTTAAAAAKSTTSLAAPSVSSDPTCTTTDNIATNSSDSPITAKKPRTNTPQSSVPFYVPHQASDWIAHYLLHQCCREQLSTEKVAVRQLKQHHRIDTLSLKDLRVIIARLQELLDTSKFPCIVQNVFKSKFSTQGKKEILHTLQKCFCPPSTVNICDVYSQEMNAMWDLLSKDKIDLNSINKHDLPILPLRSKTVVAPAIETSQALSLSIVPENQQHQSLSDNLTLPYVALAKPSSFFNAPATTASRIGNPTHTTLESQVLFQLKQMGFPDDIESTRSAISQVCPFGVEAAPTAQTIQNIVDQVVIVLVSRREEQDDAAQIDAARILSEADAESEKTQRNNIRRQLLLTSSLTHILEQFQDKSIILSSGTLKSTFLNCCNESDESMKSSLIQLLELESMALKWYQQPTPLRSSSSSRLYKRCGATCYFKFVLIPKLEENKTKEVLELSLDRETLRLQKSLFSLEEQDKAGVPKIFLQASNDAETLGWWNDDEHNEGSKSEEDDIEIIQ